MPALSNEQVELLAEKQLLGTITPEEQLLLNEWIDSHEVNAIIWNGADPDETTLRQRLFNRIKADAGITPAKLRRLQTQWWAAAAVLILCTAAYVWFFTGKKYTAPIVQNKVYLHDVMAPVTNRATIVLANGQTLPLDSTGIGALAAQGHVQIVKLADGEIAYQGTESNTIYNTLVNPRGSKPVRITLSDGTRVWLNAESSLRYPAAFTGKQRQVDITGEAYFEVAQNATVPFIVNKGNMHVQVLGTHFNVNAYDDEEAMEVSLLQGSVRVSSNTAVQLLQPGQQARMRSGIELVKDIDMEEVMAWKNERFSLRSADIQTVMRQIARWYDVDVEYKGIVNERFRVKIDRNTNVSNVFKILEATGAVHFSIEGRKIIVLP